MRLHLDILPDSYVNWTKHPTYDNANNNEDVGLDIPMQCKYTIPANARSFSLDLGFRCNSSQGWMLVPRSSITKTPIRLSNSIGIIDKNYTGKVIAKVDNLSDSDVVFEENKCFFQIVAFNGNLPTFSVVSSILKSDKRGDGGFGSTG